VRANFVVPLAEDCQGGHKLACVADNDWVEALLECAEQSLDASIHPGAAHGRAFMANADEGERRMEQTGCELRGVVGADCARLAVFADRDKEVAQKRPGVGPGDQPRGDRQARAVVDDAKDIVGVAISIAFAGKVESPFSVDRNFDRLARSEFLSPCFDRVAMEKHDLVNIAFADRLFLRMDAVEGVGEFGEAEAREMGAQANQVFDDGPKC
jgi:hypothetical protein